MRFSMAAASCVLLAALIAGCSNSSQGTSALPGAPGVGQTVSGHGGALLWGKPQFPQGHMSHKQMMQWFAAGKMLGPIPASRMPGLMAAQARPNMFHGRPDKTAKVGLWVNNLGTDTILGQTVKATVNVTSFSPEDNGCYTGPTIKTFEKNLYVTCAETTTAEAGGVQEYSEAGVLENTYNGGCPTNIPASECEEFYGYGNDNFANSSYVFVSDEYFENAYDCYTGPYGGYYCDYNFGAGWEYWPKSGSSSQPTAINVYNDYIGGFSVFEVGYSDIDNTGDIYGYGYGCNASYTICGTGILEVSNATGGSPSVTWALTPGTLPGTNYGYWGGVYISNKGTVLNVNDSYTSDTYRYKLPVTQSSVPFQTLGPMPGVGSCSEEVIAGGFSKGDKAFADGNECGAIDLVKVKSGGIKAATSSEFSYPTDAAYVKADK